MLNNVWNNVFNIWSLYVNLFWNWSPLILSSGLSIVSLGSTSQHLLVFCKDLGNCVMVMNHCKKCSVLLSHGRKYNAICCSCVQKFALFECRERKKRSKKGWGFLISNCLGRTRDRSLSNHWPAYYAALKGKENAIVNSSALLYTRGCWKILSLTHFPKSNQIFLEFLFNQKFSHLYFFTWIDMHLFSIHWCTLHNHIW